MSELFHLDRRKNRDRRNSERLPVSGRVAISFDNPVPVKLDVDMIESSATGFRAVHDSSALEAGLNVRYQETSASGYARVIWTHVLQGRRISGFLRLPDANV
jgi:hypothetical protein